MEYRRLGRTGVEVSAHCLGTMMFGASGNPDHDESISIIRAALDAGINFVDTADIYSRGESEEIVGKAITGRRDEIVLATKVHGVMGEGLNERGTSRYWITKAVEHSLTRLGVDHIDLYQIHRPHPHTDIDETLGVLDDLVTAGKIRYAGCSTFPAHRIVESQWTAERRGFTRFVCEQPPYSVFVRAAERDVFEVCQKFGMGVIVWSPLAGGWLAGRYRKGQEAPEDSRAARYAHLHPALYRRFDLARETNQRKLDVVEELIQLADDAGIKLSHLAIAFTLAHPAVTSAIIGPRTREQLDDLIAGADVKLDDDLLDAIDELVPPGHFFEQSDLGWEPPGLAAAARRRQP